MSKDKKNIYAQTEKAKKLAEQLQKKCEKVGVEATIKTDYEIAVDVVKEAGKVSILLIQRALKCGYDKASEIIDRMEQEGVVSVANHVGQREVLLNEENKVLSESDVKNQIGKCLPKEKDDKQPQLSAVEEKDTQVGGIAVDRLRSLIERIERLQEETKALSGDIRDIFAEAKSAGFDVKIMRSIIKLRKMDAADRDEQEFLLETYRKALDV